MDQRKYRILIGMPTYLGKMEAGILAPMLQASKRPDISFNLMASDTSANCMGMNILWCAAIDAYERGEATHFLMHHSDIIPEPFWLDKMVDVMERTGADLLSAIVPIKDNKGFTSTAIDESPVPSIPAPWRVRRLTMHEVMSMEPTFTHPKLLLNDGLMLVDLSKPWVDKVCFRFDDTILKVNGKRTPVASPEDWHFSRAARELGAKVYATREVQLRHVGTMGFPNNQAWGDCKTDALYQAEGIPAGVLDTMDSIPGWFSVEEGAALYRAAVEALKLSPKIVEVGSWKGRSSYVLARACKEAGKTPEDELPVLHAVDPHEGNLYANGQGLKTESTAEEWDKNMIRTGVRAHAWMEKCKSTEVNWYGGAIGLLFIDGLHDYENVSKDFEHFYRWIPEGGFVAFHDYHAEDPDVMRFVDEEIAEGSLEHVKTVGSLKICKVPVGARKGLAEMRV
jgi:hypothetical protein